MLAQESIPYAVDLHFLDADPSFPAGQVCPSFHTGNFNNYDDVLNFGRQMDIITIEIENVNTDALKVLESEGKRVYPQASVIELIKDKGTQKQFYKKNNLPTSEFILADNKAAILQLIEDGHLKYPFVQKSRTEGYDGRGVSLIRSSQDDSKLMDTSSVIESLVDIDKELAISIAVNESKQKITFPVVEMVFNSEGNLLDYLLSPARIGEDINKRCIELAEKIVDKLGMTGILAIELFLTKNGDILINEIAPRTHNSGHHTLNASNYSQFEIHLRSIMNMPLNPIEQYKQAVMINLLGDKDYTGDAIYEGLEQVLSLDDVYVHLYGKKTTKPLRKMGHVNILENDDNVLDEKIEFVKSSLKVKA
ncbi:MAG: 5-(carboxyamino)imidazole ribonucleotide synthase [Bacteroidia bacterium]|nr:5-(carboxyamino)imidazole ribonucleotide synthase [Bacteroidia bacterium]